MTVTLRRDELGHETLFHVVTNLISDNVCAEFERRITTYALGYTKYAATGGWKGTEERIHVYRVATLTELQRRDLIEFLLNNTAMQDVYVVLPGGLAVGYCHEELAPPAYHKAREALHGTRDTGWPHS